MRERLSTIKRHAGKNNLLILKKVEDVNFERSKEQEYRRRCQVYVLARLQRTSFMVCKQPLNLLLTMKIII